MQFQTLLLACHKIAVTLQILTYKKFDFVPQLTGGQKVCTVKNEKMIMIQPVQVLAELSQDRLNTCIILNYATVSKFDMLKLREVNYQVQSVLKRHVQFCLIASLIACVPGKACSLSKNSWFVQPISNRTIILTMKSIKICIINHLYETRFHMDYRGGN